VLSTLEATTRSPAPPPGAGPAATLHDFDASLLDADQAALASQLEPPGAAAGLRATTRERVAALLDGLEFKVDALAEGVHGVQQLRATVQEAAERVRRDVAAALERRESEARERNGMSRVGVGDVLRSLSRVGRS